MFIWELKSMNLKVKHGYFMFRETKVGQISDFMSLTGVSLVPKDDYYTFESLLDAPEYSLIGGTVLNAAAIATFEGKPWEVFEENSLVYNFSTDLVVPILTIVQKTTISPAGNRFISPGLILPGSVTDDGSRVKDYAAWFSRDTLRWLYSEVSYV